jgi:hypothetical protein
LAGRKKVTHILKEAAIDWLTRYKLGVHVEMGLVQWGKLRADLLAHSLKGEITIVEVKSGWPDFAADHKKGKWKEYLAHCDRFFFAVPPDFLDKKSGRKFLKIVAKYGVGVLTLDRNTGYMFARKRCTFTPRLDRKGRFNLICRLSWRGAAYSKRNRVRRTRRYLSEA